MPKYDVAIMGAGVAGLCTAALLASAGKKVFLADPSDGAGGAVMPIEKDGLLLVPGPDITYGFEKGGALQILHTALGFDRDETGRPARYQVALPDRRITVAPRNEETLDELRREFPHEIDACVRLYRDSHRISLKIATSRLFSYVADRRSASALLQRYRFSPELNTFFDIQSRYHFRTPVSKLSLSGLVLMLQTPPEHLPGGFGRLAARLLDHCQERGADVFWNEPWPELLFKGRKLTGIRTSKGTIEARAFIVNAPWPGDAKTIIFGIRNDVLPVKMENTVLCLHEYRAPWTWSALAVSSDAAAEGMRTLTASFCTGGSADLSHESLADRIQSTIPFFRDFIVTSEDGLAGKRSFVLPENMPLKERAYACMPPLPVPSSIGNLTLLPDASYAVLRAVRVALTVSTNLR